MSRGPSLIIVSLVTIAFLVGCGYIPILSETGLLPGPPMSTVARSLSDETLSELLSDYGDIGTQPCPDGKIWIGTLNFGAGAVLDINNCIDRELAASYADSFGL